MQMWNGIPLINDSTPNDELFDAVDQMGRKLQRGLKPRNYAEDPPEMFAPPTDLKVYEESEWDALIDEQEATESSLEHIYLNGPGGNPVFENLDQNGDGYCWAYSTGHSIMISRMRDHLPLVRLNPHATAAIIKGGRDEGGWCGLSAKFARENGYAVEGDGPGQWPLHSRNLKYDTPAMRASMALHKITEDWVDLTRDVYDQQLSFKQLATCLLCNNPCPVDFNWWGHSVCAIRFVRIEKGSYGILILNSWKNWGRHGLAVLQGSKARPDSAVCTRVTRASAA